MELFENVFQTERNMKSLALHFSVDENILTTQFFEYDDVTITMRSTSSTFSGVVWTEKIYCRVEKPVVTKLSRTSNSMPIRSF